MGTIPGFASKTLKINDREEMKVPMDEESKRGIFELVKG